MTSWWVMALMYFNFGCIYLSSSLVFLLTLVRPNWGRLLFNMSSVDPPDRPFMCSSMQCLCFYSLYSNNKQGFEVEKWFTDLLNIIPSPIHTWLHAGRVPEHQAGQEKDKKCSGVPPNASVKDGMCETDIIESVAYRLQRDICKHWMYC